MGGSDWESALRKLTRKPPAEGAKTFVLDAMRGDASDRAAALTMASAADAALQGAIAYALGLREAQEFNGMFFGEGLFATFDRRIAAASALNLTGPIANKNATIIRNIRNVFAHAMSDVSFADDPIVKACGRIKLSTNNQFFVDHEETRKIRYAFGYACNEIYSGIFARIGPSLIGASHRSTRKILPDLPILP
jgi:hypothetical protein